MIILKPQPNMLTIWRILLSLAAIGPAFFIAFFFSGALYQVLTILWFILYLGAFLFYFPRLYQSLIYIINDDMITLRRGVFYQYVYSIPLRQVQFTALSASPISRLFGIVTLRVVAPGSKVYLPGLLLADARKFSKEITQFQETFHEQR